MAKSTVTHVTDDIDGSPNAEAIMFGFQGVEYSIDLSQKNLEKLSKALGPFIAHATKQRGPARLPASKAERSYDIVELREWAGKNKIQLGSRGRIPATVVESYRAAGGR